MPARSAVRIPPNGSQSTVPKAGNPFTPGSADSDWVEVEKPWPTPKTSQPPALPTRTRTFESTSATDNPQSRLRSVGARTPDLHQSAPARSSDAPTHVMKQTLRKPAPPKPAPKPKTLRAHSNSQPPPVSASVAPPPPAPRRTNNASPASVNNIIQPPPRRMTGSPHGLSSPASGRNTATPPPLPPTRRAAQNSRTDEDGAPMLPPRRTNTGVSLHVGLMDDAVEEEGLSKWQALKPQ